MHTTTAYAAGIAAAALTLYLALPTAGMKRHCALRAVPAKGEQPSEPAIDTTLADSFPASDPPGW